MALLNNRWAVVSQASCMTPNDPRRRPRHPLTRKWCNRHALFTALILSWLLAPPPPLSAQADWAAHDDLFSFSFCTETIGWACGRWGTILHTTDGGRTWQRQASGTRFTLTSIHFVDNRTGWAVGDGGTILGTTNGGNTWEKQESPVPYYHMGVYFMTSRKGWIVSERTHILATNDGGRTWEVRFSDEDYILKAISFSDTLHGWAAGEFGHIYHTRDGGVTWEKQAGGIFIDEETGELEGEAFLFDIEGIDSETAWATGIEGRVIMTADGGKTWRKVPTGAPNTQLYCLATDRAGTFVIGGRGICLFSHDHGRSWKAAAFTSPVAYSWIYGMACLGPSHFVAGGEGGAIYRGNAGTFQRIRY